MSRRESVQLWGTIAVIILAGSVMAIVGYGFIRHWLRTGETWEATQERKEREAKAKQP